ncbi:hypothetical protein LXT21_02035 [Myxococcus sp. K38C18041901]|uniref:hypothetical protein n=1 Tax=Myxococcus guangdongensis TaxID=2906760 RepID=UPI0020A78F8D|nr:hypothetical protein [Myxococcus guangdongensis]MCP3057550.1 hypothetical protein [Myxococcus guangdongensis]
MNEREAYLQKMDAEKQRIDARIAEVEAQSDIRQAQDEVQELRGVKERREAFRRKLEELRQRGTEDFERGKQELLRACDDTRKSLDDAEEHAGLKRAAYERKREAELRQLGAQFDGYEADISRSRAEDSLLTKEELRFLRSSFSSTGESLRRLMKARGGEWARLRGEYEASWRELVENSRKIRADSPEASQTPPSPS